MKEDVKNILELNGQEPTPHSDNAPVGDGVNGMSESANDDTKSRAVDSQDMQEDHVAVDDLDAARMLKKAIVENVKEEDQPSAANLTLRKVLGGDILNTQFVRRQIWLFLLIAGFMILYVSNRYSCQKDLLLIDKLNEELKDAKYRALSSNSLVTEKCRESHILEMLKNNADSTLHIPTQPPYIINVPAK